MYVFRVGIRIYIYLLSKPWFLTYRLSSLTCPLSPVTCHLSPVSYHLSADHHYMIPDSLGEALNITKRQTLVFFILNIGKPAAPTYEKTLTHPFVNYLYSAVTPKQLKKVLPVIKQTILTFFRDSKSWRASKSLYWFKSYGIFAEWVDFAYWWSCIRKGLCLQPAQ